MDEHRNLSADTLNQEELVLLVFDFAHRLLVHHTLWFREVEHQLGFKRALRVMDRAWEKRGATWSSDFPSRAGSRKRRASRTIYGSCPAARHWPFWTTWPKAGSPRMASGSRLWKKTTACRKPNAATTPPGPIFHLTRPMPSKNFSTCRTIPVSTAWKKP